MYETLMHTLRSFLGSDILRRSLVAAVSVTAAGLIAYANPRFRKALPTLAARPGWRGNVISWGVGVFKFLVIFLLLRLLMTALAMQAGIFARQHGRITTSNRSAVLMKWGYPHEQRELAVNHTRERTWVTRQLLVTTTATVKSGEQVSRERVVSSSFWQDEQPPVQAVDGVMPTVLSAREEVKHVDVTQLSMVSADVAVTVRNSPRRLGNANYAGYTDEWQFTYVVTNRSVYKTDAHMSFSLPAQTGIFDGMYVRVDGAEMAERTSVRNSAIKWAVDMEPGASCVVEIGYDSRGLEHLRYIPKRMSQTGHYRVVMRIEGIPADRLDYPIGSMPPAEDLSQIAGKSYALTWRLDNALTSYDIGVKLPVAEQPDYHFARLLHDAPAGLVLMFALVVIYRVILGHGIRPEVLGVLGVSYCLHYTFMGRLSDVLVGFPLPFLISSIVMVGLITWFRINDREGWLERILEAAIFGICCTLYPLAVVDKDNTALWMQFFYVGGLVLFCVLFVYRSALRNRDSQV